MNLRRKILRRAAPAKVRSVGWSQIQEADDDLMWAEIRRRHPGFGEEHQAHFQMHLVVEKQIRDQEPDFVGQAALRLEQAGIDGHEIRHMLAIPLANQLHRALQQNLPYDGEMHRREVEDLLRRYA